MSVRTDAVFDTHSISTLASGSVVPLLETLRLTDRDLFVF